MEDIAQLPMEGLKGSNRPGYTRRSRERRSIHKLSVIIPCFNEEETVAEILERVVSAPLPAGMAIEVVVVDDCSTDQSDEAIREFLQYTPGAPVCHVRHDVNQGKGAAIQTALLRVTGDYVLIQDADLEYNPAEYGRLIRPVLEGNADIVYGSRFMGGQPHRILFFWHTLGNKLLTFISNMVTNMNLTDAHTCYKLIRTPILQAIPLEEKRFAFDAELNAKIARLKGVRIYEVGVSYYGRTFAEGKKIRLRDAFRTLWCLLKYAGRRTQSVPAHNPVAETTSL